MGPARMAFPLALPEQPPAHIHPVAPAATVEAVRDSSTRLGTPKKSENKEDKVKQNKEEEIGKKKSGMGLLAEVPSGDAPPSFPWNLRMLGGRALLSVNDTAGGARLVLAVI